MSIKTYRSVRRPLIGTAHREHGELVPEAHTWPLIDSLVHSGVLAEAEVEEEEFRAAVERHCPELAERVLAAVGLPVAEPEPEPARKPKAAKAKPDPDPGE